MNEMYVLQNKKTAQKIIVIEKGQLELNRLREIVGNRHNMNPDDLQVKSMYYYPFQTDTTFDSFVVK